MTTKKILLLGGHDEATRIVFNALQKEFGVHAAIIENKEPLSIFLKRRIRRLGMITVMGQVAFQFLVAKPLAFFTRKRKAQIIMDYQLDTSDFPADKMHKVESVNAPGTIQLIQEINPDLIIVNGTRIISKKVLQCVDCRFINTHAGITPLYRGVHGSYWALVHNDIEHCGVTVHFVDEGIDTGNIIQQELVQPTPKDNFSTYPLLQLGTGIPLLLTAVTNYFAGNIRILKEEAGESKLYYHPTIWQYFYYLLSRKVK